jgi:hypothetical protein
MLAIARYALKGPMHAATVAGILAVLSLFIPLLSILSGAIVSLIILTQGLVSGTRVILVSIVGITAVSFLLTQSLIMGLSIGLVQWLPVIILAELLRRTRSISFTLVVGMGLAMLAVILQFMLWPGVEDTLMEILRLMFQDMQQQQGVDMQQIEAGLQNVVHSMTMLMIAVMYFIFAISLLIGRWYQSRLSDSRGFREEFYAIRLGKSISIMALVIAVIGMILQQDWLIALLMVVALTFLFQGLAVVHSWSKHYDKSGLLGLLYMAMIIFPQIAGVTAMLGVVDNWMDFRAKLKSVPVNTDD